MPTYEHAKLLAVGLDVDWQEFAPKFNAATKARDTKKYIKGLEKFYQQRFDGKKISDPFLQEMLSSFKFPQELMEIEARAQRVAILTHDFWSDFKSFGLEPAEQTEETRPYTTRFTNALQRSLTKGVEYRYFYPVDEPGIEQPLQAVQKLHQDLGSKSTTFHAVSGPLQWSLFAGHERVFYFDPEHETGQNQPYNLGFSIDKLGVQSPFHLLLHEHILAQHLERYNKAIQQMLQTPPHRTRLPLLQPACQRSAREQYTQGDI